MTRIQGITLAICTRNRHEDLERCLRSIAQQTTAVPVEVLIVDDGEIPPVFYEQLSSILNVPGMHIEYLKKRSPGLLLSRIEAISKSKYGVILFVDDDAVLGNGYLQRLEDLYDRFPKAVGFGGRDILIGNGSYIWRQFCSVFLYGSRKPGKLSLSGYGGSMIKWGSMKRPFETEYMAGCNMSFRKHALLDVQPVEWLSSYSLGEDIYLSQCARKHGEIWIDPHLTVIHHHSLLSREQEDQVAYMEVVNHYYLLRANASHSIRYLFLLWTSCGLLIRSLAGRTQRSRASGYWKAIIFVIKNNRGRPAHESVVNHGNR